MTPTAIPAFAPPLSPDDVLTPGGEELVADAPAAVALPLVGEPVDDVAVDAVVVVAADDDEVELLDEVVELLDALEELEPDPATPIVVMALVPGR